MLHINPWSREALLVQPQNSLNSVWMSSRDGEGGRLPYFGFITGSQNPKPICGPPSNFESQKIWGRRGLGSLLFFFKDLTTFGLGSGGLSCPLSGPLPPRCRSPPSPCSWLGPAAPDVACGPWPSGGARWEREPGGHGEGTPPSGSSACTPPWLAAGDAGRWTSSTCDQKERLSLLVACIVWSIVLKWA